MTKPPLGSGSRFASLEHSLADRPGVTDPGALAAAIGRKKYGSAKFDRLAAHGKRHTQNDVAKALASK